MSILSSSHPLNLTYDLSASSLSATQELLEKRREYSTKLAEAFEELIVIAQAETAESDSIDSCMESGLYFSA